MSNSIESSIREKVEQVFSPRHLELINESHQHHRGGNETHFKLLMVAEAFVGMGRVERQRKVQLLFDQERAQGLHALTLRLLTPEEWEKSKDNLSFQSPKCVNDED